MNIGERIKECRESLGLTQTEVAKKIETTKQTLYKYENNIITNIPSDKIELLAKVLDTTPAYLMGWEDNLTPENADLTVDTLCDPELLNYLNKLMILNDTNKKTIFNMIDFLLSQNDVN